MRTCFERERERERGRERERARFQVDTQAAHRRTLFKAPHLNKFLLLLSTSHEVAEPRVITLTVFERKSILKIDSTIPCRRCRQTAAQGHIERVRQHAT